MTENCDILCITTTDREIGNVWNELQKQDLKDKIICHFSGSYSSAVFQGIDEKKGICLLDSSYVCVQRQIHKLPTIE